MEDLTELPFSDVFVYGGKSPIDIREPNNLQMEQFKLGKDIVLVGDKNINKKL